MYKSLLDKVSRGRNLPPKRAAFFMAGTIPEKWRIYGIFRFCYHDFADSRCCAGRWPGRVGRCQSAGGLRLGQPWLQKPGHEALDGQVVATKIRKEKHNPDGAGEESINVHKMNLLSNILFWSMKLQRSAEKWQYK